MYVLAEIKVVKVEIRLPTYPSLPPALTLQLENGKVFPMFSIPVNTIVAIGNIIYGKRIVEDERKNFGEILAEIPLVREYLRKIVKKVVIDRIDNSDRFYATATLALNGNEKSVTMVPSSAILLALLANAEIYVDEMLLGLMEPQDEEKEFYA